MDVHRPRGARAARSRARANRTRIKRSWPARRLFRNDQCDTLSHTCRAAAVITRRRAYIGRACMHRIGGEELYSSGANFSPRGRHSAARGGNPPRGYLRCVGQPGIGVCDTRRKRGQQLEAFSCKNLTQLFLLNNNNPFSPTRPSKRTGHQPRYVPIRGGARPRAGHRQAL